MPRKPRKTTLSDEQIAIILEMVAAGHGYRAIGEQIGISKTHVGRLAAKHGQKPSEINTQKAQTAIDAQRNPSPERLAARLDRTEERIAAFEEIFDHAHQEALEADRASDMKAATIAMATALDKLLLLEGKAGKITETRTSTIDVVEFVRLIERHLGRPLGSDVIDAIGGIDE
jgi:hypothetical protein